MERWSGKTAVVTGASAGIGAAICVALANAGLNVVGLARRPQLVDNLRSQVTGKGSIRSRQCDVSKVEDVVSAFSWVDEHMNGTDLMVNNAGVFYGGHITDVGELKLSDKDISSIIDINLKGLIFCTRHAVASMKKRGVNGHIININSIAGHYVPFAHEFNVYSASKFGVTAFTGSLLNELASFKNSIKVTSLSPGLVATDLSVAGQGLVEFKPLQPKDVADAVLYVVSTPPSVNNLRSQVTGKGSIRSRQCDVSKVEDVVSAFSWVDEHMNGTDLMVNNAGVFHGGHITDVGEHKLSDKDISAMIDINLKGLIFCTRHAVASMKKRGVNGHIININSIVGHYVPFADAFNVYAASKYGVTAFTGSLLTELASFKNSIKVTSLSPGLVATDMSAAGQSLVEYKPLQPKDIADSILYVVSTPPSVNISELTIQPVLEKRL